MRAAACSLLPRGRYLMSAPPAEINPPRKSGRADDATDKLVMTGLRISAAALQVKMRSTRRQPPGDFEMVRDTGFEPVTPTVSR
jgi:hypothetical protein